MRRHLQRAVLLSLLAAGCAPGDERAGTREAGQPAMEPVPARHGVEDHAADHAAHAAHAAAPAAGQPAHAAAVHAAGHPAHPPPGDVAHPAALHPAGHAAHPPPHAHHGHDLPAVPGPGHTVADVHFMQMMMGHHAQAVVMAAMAPTHGAAEPVLRLAEKIHISQRDEIEMMRQWLLARGQAVPTDAEMHAMQMPGKLTPGQMRQLDAARGPHFDRLFLTLMIEHHKGALVMVDELFAAPGAAQDSDLFRFATDVAADQSDEIFVMQRLLDLLPDTGGSGKP